jgi:uncharacterized protein (TIGR03643 family)
VTPQPPEIRVMPAQLSDADVSRVVEMAWDDHTPFESIAQQFLLSEAAVVRLMRAALKPGSFRTWRRRVRGRIAKHAGLQAVQTVQTKTRGRVLTGSSTLSYPLAEQVQHSNFS